MAITHILSATTPDDPAFEIRPSHWNSAHAQLLTISGNTAGQSTFSGTNLVFSGGPNATLSINGNTLVFSGGAGAAGNTGYLSGGTTYASLGTVSFSNANNVSFGVDGQTLTASVLAQSAQTQSNVQGIIVSNTTYRTGDVSFSNANGISFGSSAGQAITASYTVPSTAGLISAVNISAGSTSNNLSALTFNNGNGVTFGLDGSTITASVAAAGGAQTGISGIVASDTTYTSGTVSFSNQNGVTIGSSVNGATQYIRLSVANQSVQTQSNVQGIIVSDTTYRTGDVSFSNVNGISFGSSAGQAITASYTRPVVSNAIASVGSATNSGTNTSRFAADDHVHAGVFSMGVSTGGNTAGDTRVDVGRFVLAGGNNITLSMATAANALNTITISAGGGGGSQSVGMSTQTAGGATAGTTGYASGSAILYHLVPGSNITMSQSVDGASGTMSIYAPSPGAAAEANWFTLAGDNTDGNTTASGSSLMLSVQGALTISGTNNSQIKISAPATSSLVGISGISISTNGSTISVRPTTGSGWNPYADFEKQDGQYGQATLQFDPMRADSPVQWDRIVIPLINTNSSNSSGSHTLSFWVGLYTRNASTLSLLASTSSSTALTHSGTAGSYSLYSGNRLFTIPHTTTISGGDYWLGFVSRTTSGGTNGSYSNLIMSNIASNFLGHFGSSHNTTYQLTLGQGVYTASTSGMPGSVGFSQIRGSDSQARMAAFIMFASGTV